jgi:hypothetical protein
MKTSGKIPFYIRSTRRNFLKAVGLGSAATLISPLNSAFGTGFPEPLHPGRNESLNDAIQTDVLVAGAGASGIPAAIAAARGGARVILIEEDGVPGGAPVDMYVAMLCGGPRVGIFKEMVDLLDMDFDLTADPIGQRHTDRWFMPSAYIQVITRMLKAESNLIFIGGSPVINVAVSDGGYRNLIRGVSIFGPDGKIRNIEAKIVIDATGTGIVAAMAGCEYLYGTEARNTYNEPAGPEQSNDEVQLCTLMLVSQRLNPEGKIDFKKLTGPRDPGVGSTRPALIDRIRQRNIGTYLHWAGTVSCNDTRDPEEISKSHQKAMEVIEEDVAHLYENGYVAHIAPRLGIREVRRIIGDKVLTVNDLINPQWPEDVIAVGKYGLDSWGATYLKEQKISMPDYGYGLPYSILLTRGMENLLVVGKSVSSTHLAQSAVRVQPIVSQMGQAAGTAAAMSIKSKTDIRSVDIKELQQKLKETGMLNKA